MVRRVGWAVSQPRRSPGTRNFEKVSRRATRPSTSKRQVGGLQPFQAWLLPCIDHHILTLSYYCTNRSTNDANQLAHASANSLPKGARCMKTGHVLARVALRKSSLTHLRAGLQCFAIADLMDNHDTIAPPCGDSTRQMKDVGELQAQLHPADDSSMDTSS